MKARKAIVYLRPLYVVNGKKPFGVSFDLAENGIKGFSRSFIIRYARACRRLGYKVRIIWPRESQRVSSH